jgi:nicotinamidase-related amidase
MQKLFSDEGPWPTPWLKRTLPNIVALAQAQPSRTIFTRFIPPANAEAVGGAWHGFYLRWRNVTRECLDPRLLELVDPLGRLVPPAIVVDKPVYSPFSGWRLPALLRRLRADLLVVSGAETDMCVLATMLGAIDLGFPVVMVEDAVCSSSDEGHDALVGLFRQRYSEQVEVVTTSALLEAWEGTTKRAGG